MRIQNVETKVIKKSTKNMLYWLAQIQGENPVQFKITKTALSTWWQSK